MQAKIYEILSSDTTLTDLAGIYDNVPDNTKRDYVIIGDDDFSDFSSHTHDGFKGTVTLHVWSESRGKKSVKVIQNRLYELLQNVDLALSGFKTLNFKIGLNTVVKDPDGRTHHGITRFDFLLGGN